MDEHQRSLKKVVWKIDWLLEVHKNLLEQYIAFLSFNKNRYTIDISRKSKYILLIFPLSCLSCSHLRMLMHTYVIDEYRDHTAGVVVCGRSPSNSPPPAGVQMVTIDPTVCCNDSSSSKVSEVLTIMKLEKKKNVS